MAYVHLSASDLNPLMNWIKFAHAANMGYLLIPLCTSDAQSSLGLSSGLLFANPVPSEHSIPKAEMDAIIAQAVHLADTEGVYGSDNTPFILAKINELSGGRTIKANKALVECNVERGTKVAIELAKLEMGDRIGADR